MPPKKKENKAAGETVEGEDPIVFLQNYQKFCKLIGMPIHGKVVQTLNDEENYPVEQLIIDDEFGPLGPGGTRALMTAIMGSGTGMKAAIAEVLRLGGIDVQIQYLELLDNNIGPRGGLALGASLSQRHNLSLLTLKLDYNSTLGTDGIIELCKGLRTNATLKQLHLSYCNIDENGGEAISDVLENSRSALEILNLNGNKLGGVGLGRICKGLSVNLKCEKFMFADNMLEQGEEDLIALELFRDCLLNPTLGLTSVDLMWNRIGEAGATVLIPALTPENTKITEFLVDLTLPMPLFEQIFRKDTGKKKGKKGGKKGGKKK